MTHKLPLIGLGLGLGLALALGVGGCSHAKPAPTARTTGAEPEHEDDDPSAPPRSAAKLDEEKAKTIALAKFPGDVVEAELEREHGHLIYSIEIRPTGQAKGTKEVNVDAIDGSIVNVEDEDDEDEDKDVDEGKAKGEDRD